MNSMVTPAAASARIRANSRSMAVASSRAVGSSRMMNRVPSDSARAISTSWRCSTLRSPASAAGSTSTPYSSSSSAARRRRPPQRIGPPRGLPVEEQVLGHRQRRDDGRALVDAGDPAPPGRPGRPAPAPARRRSVTCPSSARCSPVSTETSVDLPAPLRPTRAWVAPGRIAMLDVGQRGGRAEPLGDRRGPRRPEAGRQPAPPAASDSTCGHHFPIWLPHNACVVDVVLGHQRRRQLVFEHAVADVDDGAVVVGRARGEGLALDRGLGVEQRVLGVEVGRLRDGGVDLALADRLELLRDAVVGDDEDVLRVGRRHQQALRLAAAAASGPGTRRRPACRCP